MKYSIYTCIMYLLCHKVIIIIIIIFNIITNKSAMTDNLKYKTNSFELIITSNRIKLEDSKCLSAIKSIQNT